MRLDQRLVALGLAPSRARAQALVKAGAVAVDGVVETKAARTVTAGADVSMRGAPESVDFPWVSRAGVKLAHALDVFGLSPADATVLDVGASTGGFTDVVLARGARRVYALDVGRGQLHPRLAADPRVVALPGLDARDVDRARVPDALDWLTADVSFISIEKALPTPLALAEPGARLVVLVKPQFEVGRARIGKGGIVKDAAARAAAVAAARRFLEAEGWLVDGETESPIAGGDGNVETLLAARKR